jgi:hypothetical protein
MGCTVAQLYSAMDSLEFSHWQQYAQIEPFGGRSDDARAALIATVVARSAGAKSVNVADFMPKTGHPTLDPKTRKRLKRGPPIGERRNSNSRLRGQKRKVRKRTGKDPA